VVCVGYYFKLVIFGFDLGFRIDLKKVGQREEGIMFASAKMVNYPPVLR
jgi:hypothetical protein